MKINRGKGRAIKGFTLIELLLVIAILSAAVGAASYGIALVYSRDAEKCARMMNDEMETARMSSRARKEHFSLMIDADQQKIILSSDETGVLSEKELPAKVNITITAEGSTGILSGKKLLLEFDKSAGQVKKANIDGASVSENYSAITVQAESDNGNKKASVVLILKTGRHYVAFNG